MSTTTKPYKPSDWVIEPGTPEHDAYMAAKQQQPNKFIPKTPEQVRGEFIQRGESIASWARARDLPSGIVFDVLSGRVKGLRGNAHRAAVLLGLKDGELPDQYRRAD